MTKNSKKKLRTLIVTGSVLVVLCIVGVCLSVFLREDEPEEVSESYTIFNVKDSQLKNIVLTNENGTDMEFYKEDDVWYYAKDKEFPANQDIFGTIGEKLDTMYGYRKLEVTEENLEQFGINDYTIRLALTDQSGKTYEYIMGRHNEAMSAYYLYDKRNDSLYMVDSMFSTLFGMDLYAYAVCDEFLTLDSSTFRDMVVASGEKMYQFLYEPEGDANNMIYSKWYFGRPFLVNKACQDTQISDLTTTISELTFQKLAAYNTDEESRKAFGIDGSKYVQINYDEENTDAEGNVVSTTPHTVVLEVGDEDESGSYYYVHVTDSTLLSKEDTGNVNLMSRTDIDQLLNLDPMDYAYKLIFSSDLANMEDMTFRFGDDSYTIDIDSSADPEQTTPTSWVFTMNGKELDNEAFRLSYRDWARLSADEFFTEDSTNMKESDPVIQIVIHQSSVDAENLKTLEINFTNYNASYYQVECNGVADSLIGKASVQAAIESMLKTLNQE